MTPITSRRRTLALIGGTAAALAAACGGSDEKNTSSAPASGSAAAKATVAPPKERKTLTFVDGFEPKSYVEGGGLFALREGVTDGLVRINFESKFEPALASGWEQPDETAWRFALRPNLTFHNGAPVNGEAVSFILNQLAASKGVIGAFKGATTTDTGAGGVVVKTTALVPFMPAVLADGTAAIFDKSMFNGDPATALPIGTGPFKVTSFRPGDRRVMEAFDAHWGGRPGVSGVQYLFIPEAQTRANQLKTGSADIMRLVNPPDIAGLKSNAELQVLTQPLTRVRALYLNMVKRPTSDIRVRQAIAHAIERQVIVDTVLEGQSNVQTSLFRKDLPWGQDLKGLPYDPNRAKTLLEQAGYTAQNPLSITLTTYPTRAELPDLAQVLQQQLKKVGIDCKIAVQDSTVLEPAARRGDLDLTLIARNPLFLFDPQSIFESDYMVGGSYNLSVYSGLDDRIKAAATIADTQKRYDAYRAMEKKLIEEDVNTVVLNSYIQIDATRKTVSGYRPHPTDAIALTAAILKS